jgi:hypothetical protein
MARNVDKITEFILSILYDIKLANLIPGLNPCVLLAKGSYFPWYGFTKKKITRKKINRMRISMIHQDRA